MGEERYRDIICQMTLEEKAGLCSGGDYWHTKAIERLGIRAIMMADGPNGLRKQDEEADHLGINESIRAVCFPLGCLAACSFDRDMMYEMGQVLGRECRGEGVSVLLGPAINMKRSPLCGRNFEYLSEDPFLAGELAAAWVQGLQSQGVSACVKHYLGNNQEHRRMTSSSQIDERTLREIYLPAFERVVKKARPWAVMSSYNRVNGEYVAESYHFLTEVLREQWGFDGVVISDWGGVADRVSGLRAGLELEMPTSHGYNDRLIVEAVQEGRLPEEVLDRAVERILKLLERTDATGRSQVFFDREADHRIAAKMAEQSIVLLKNEEKVLPLKAEEPIAFIGAYGEKLRYQGGGSGHINSFFAPGAFETARKLGYPVTFAAGFSDQETGDNRDLLAEAVEAAGQAKAAVIFAGLPEEWESEGYDRTGMAMPEYQNELIRQVAMRQPNTIVVLAGGAPVEMPWEPMVKAVLMTYLGGEAVGEAVVSILYGRVNPSGRLAETFPMKLQDNPSYLFYPGEGDRAEYREGIFVGYRYYTTKEMAVRYPFGYGLSYTTFSYGPLSLEKKIGKPGEVCRLKVEVTNTGDRAGSEVVQLYVGSRGGEVLRPLRELKGFEKVWLEPGETKTVVFSLDERAFAYFDEEAEDWRIEAGEYEIAVGTSARDMAAKVRLSLKGSSPKVCRCTLNSTLGDLVGNEKSRPLVQPLMERYQESLHRMETGGKVSCEAVPLQMVESMVRYMPLRSLISLGGFSISRKELLELVDRVNGAWE